MTDYVLIYRGGNTTGSPEELQRRMQKWITWMQELAEAGHLKDRGHPLEGAGKTVRGRQKSVVDGPFAEAKDAIGGFSLIQARDLDAAVEISKGCPIFEADSGAVEVRPIRPM
jgi:hypothetical protein